MRIMNKKEQTLKDYHERINKVLIYINDNLGEKMELEKLASVSNFSVFHFHRIMRAHLNESLGSFIVRLRIDSAARLIEFSNDSLTEIAYKVGYEMPSSFNKAFKKRFALSPNEFRQKQKEKLKLDYIEMNKIQDNLDLEPRISEENPRKIVFCQSIGEYSGEGTGKAWEKVWEFIKKYNLFNTKMEYFGIGYDDPNVTETEKCRYDACVTVEKEVKAEGGIAYRVMKGGLYAVFSYKGSYSKLAGVYNSIFRNWLPSSGYSLRDVPSFEKYINNPFDTKKEELLTEIYIPVE